MIPRGYFPVHGCAECACACKARCDEKIEVETYKSCGSSAWMQQGSYHLNPMVLRTFLTILKRRSTHTSHPCNAPYGAEGWTGVVYMGTEVSPTVRFDRIGASEDETFVPQMAFGKRERKTKWN
jgi:hypothetical protein